MAKKAGNRKKKVKKLTITQMDILKADRCGRYQGEQESEGGWVGTHKVHKNKKQYNRNKKHKNKEDY